MGLTFRPGQGAAYWLLAATYCFIWALGFPISKLAIAQCPPELFLAIRFIAAGGIMLLWALWKGYLTSAVPWLGLIALGLVNFGLGNGLAWAGIKTTSAGLATIIASIQPLIVGIVGAPLLSDRLTPMRVLGLVLGIGGVAFVVRNRIVLGGEDAFGVVLIVGSVFAQAAGTLFYKRWSPRVPLTVLVGTQQFAAGVALLAFSLAFEDIAHATFDTTVWLSILYMAILNSIVTFQIWFFLLSKGSATSVASLQFVMPPLGVVFSWMVLGEPIHLLDLVGLVPVALGIRLTTRPST
ncbi:MAG TPA: DMT family transporter [Magnetospirillaceae bacterium]|jgi:drug/metabolite transporter (DMT)-like permease